MPLRLLSLAACCRTCLLQAGELAALLEELGGESLPFQEVQEAGAALRVSNS